MGYDADVLMVKWMYEYLVDDLTRQAERHALNNVGNARTLKVSFLSGAVSTIDERFQEIINERLIANSTAGTGLMVLKQDAIAEKFGTVKYQTSSYSVADPNAYAAGVKAGENVNINRPLGQAEQQKRWITMGEEGQKE